MSTTPASAATLASATIPGTSSTSGPIAAAERLQVLDILRGFAILVMFIVHFVEFSPGFDAAADLGLPMGGTMGAAAFQAIMLFLISKGFAIFSILFGVSFAIQLRRADARGEDVRWRFLRRLLGVGAFGVLTAVLIGPMDLFGYATAGVWLLFLRRWSVRALLVALLASATLIGIWNVAVGGYQWATLGAEGANAVFRSPHHPISPARQAALDQLEAVRRWNRTGQGPHPSFPQRVAARFVSRVYGRVIADFWGDWQRGRPGLLLGSMSGAPLTLFLIGLLAVRLRVFDQPTEHRRLLFATMLVGAALWAIDAGKLYELVWPWMPAIPVGRVAYRIRNFFFIFGGNAGIYLALTYIAAITLLVGYSKTWEHRLAAIFGAAGRLALTNYLLQLAVLRVLFDNYGFASRLTPQWAPIAGIVLFSALVAFSRWWLARFRLGPAEWLLRSITYARIQPLRRASVQSA